MHFVESTDMAQIVSLRLAFIHWVFILCNVRELSEGLCTVSLSNSKPYMRKYQWYHKRWQQDDTTDNFFKWCDPIQDSPSATCVETLRLKLYL
jgi:hypothetical protein